MHDKEAIDMMQRCKNEITSLHREIDRLRPKSEAYDAITIILGLLPQRSVGMGEDLMWILDKRIREIEQSMAAATPANVVAY